MAPGRLTGATLPVATTGPTSWSSGPRCQQNTQGREGLTTIELSGEWVSRLLWLNPRGSRYIFRLSVVLGSLIPALLLTSLVPGAICLSLLGVSFLLCEMGDAK